ncbi:carboxypeptidase M32 [Fibrobacterota bacterium]
MNKEYQRFISLVNEIYSIKSAQALLGWDQETMMPPRGGKSRAESSAVLSKVAQEKYCHPELGELIETLQEAKDLSKEEQANLREVKKDRDKLLKIPARLTQELAMTTSLAQQTWAEAMPKNDTSLFNPWLKKVFDLSRELAECLGYEQCPYDALLDQYEPEATAEEIAVILADLKDKTVPLLQKITHSPVEPDRDLLTQSFPVQTQKMFNDMVLRDLGFQLEAGRLDISAHPFTEGICPGDVRLTTRYNEHEVMGSISATVHEGGHGLYEQGFSPVYYNTPMAEAVSLGIHESQSRLWENQVGRGLPFWKNYFSKLKKVFPEQLAKSFLADFHLALNEVKPSFIRVGADEVSYNLHIILRFEIEKDLFEGNLKIEDVEEAWNEKMKRLLGLSPDQARNGYLQDVHWSAGLIGYFPAYSLGNLYSAQLFNQARKDIQDLDENIEKGDFYPLREWLRDRVHKHGRRYSPAELVEKVTGEPPSSRHFADYITGKYTELYKL